MSERKHIHLPSPEELWQNLGGDKRETRRILRPVGEAGYQPILAVSQRHGTDEDHPDLSVVCDALCAALDDLRLVGKA